MIQSNGLLATIAGVSVIAVLLVAGLGVNTVSGQATDAVPEATATVPGLPGDEVTAPEPVDSGPPPASPIEPADPTGGPAAAGEAPTGLPDAGSGPGGASAGIVTLFVLLAVAAIAILGAGMTSTARRAS
jgi:hypothetical protein